MGIGFICLVLGAIGSAVPFIPTFPFLIISAFAFSKSSKKINNWFKSTKLYKNNLESYFNGEGMSFIAKIKIMLTITGLMTIGFLFMNDVPLAQMILFFVWVFHIVYFAFIVKRKL